MDKEQNINEKERLEFVQEVCQEARDSIAQLFAKNHLRIKEVIGALAAISGSMTEEISEELPHISKDEVKERFIKIYEAYLSCE
ncbi:MAG: hypothetical protein IKJ81_03660 [Bacteroidales bacterium]|nr:hypothetical protein [Bacteroidales bacterium]